MNPPVPLTERKRRQARQRIIQAADELFLARGFDDVSVSDIAERAEVGRTTFFRHFTDKQEVVFAKEQELLEVLALAADADADATVARNATEAVEQLLPIVLAVCSQATANPEAAARHYRLVEDHHELRARDAVKMQQIADKLSDVLIRRGSDEPVAVLAGQIAVACYQTARRLSSDPRTWVDATGSAFRRVLTLGDSAAQ
jgi:AcrR family transcriptional regulator